MIVSRPPGWTTAARHPAGPHPATRRASIPSLRPDPLVTMAAASPARTREDGPVRGWRRRAGTTGFPGAAVGGLVAALLLGGCGADEGARSTPASGLPTPTPATPGDAGAPPTAAPASAEEVRRSGRALVVDGVTVHALAPSGSLREAAADDGALTLLLPTAPGQAADTPALLLAGPEGTRAATFADGTAVVRDGRDAVVVGLVARDARLEAGEDGLVAVVPRAEATGSTDSAARGRVVVGTGAVASAGWEDRGDEGGLSLVVVPRPWVRAAGAAGVEAVWSALGARADLGADAVAPGMRDQLECHALGAPDKESWNLEPWRPDVGLLATLAARCNPA